MLIESPELSGNIDLLFDFSKGKKLTYYIGPSFTSFLKWTGSYSIGILAGAQLQLSSKSLFGELGTDLSISKDGHKKIILKNRV